MIRLFTRKSPDVRYLTHDPADELGGLRDGPALWRPLDDHDGEPRAVLRGARTTVLGYDLVVAAPRPASALVAVGTTGEGRATVAAHRAAVADALSYLEDRAVVATRTVLGDPYVTPTAWSAVASFTHGVNRAGEPHLHDHVLVGAADAGGRRIDGRALFVHLGAADAVYRSRLRAEIGRRAGRDAWRSLGGREYVDGVDEGVRALWPGRASDREPKCTWSREEIATRWRADLAHYEPGPSVPTPRRDRDRLDEHAFGAAFEGRTHIGRPQVVVAWADAATFGASRAAIEAGVDRWYPELAGERGQNTHLLTRERARQSALVRERGPRHLEVDPPGQVRSIARSRDRSSDTWGR